MWRRSVGRSIDGICFNGHSIWGKNILWRSGGTTGGQYKVCRKCYNAHRGARLKLRYEKDPVYRERVKKRSRETKIRNRKQKAQQSDV